MSPQLEIQLIAILVATSCALPGVFLILRQMAMMADAISHTILLGIVLAFFITKDLSSPFLIIGAALMGTITVFLVETINKTKLVNEDAAIGLIFPFLFSLGIILITLYAGNIHLDVDAVLLGELAFAPFNRLVINGVDIGPKSLYTMLGVLILNILYISLFFKELKLSTFDTGLAAALGFSPVFIHYSLMTLVSITAVSAFDAVGAILVLAFMVGPPATAYLITDNLTKMLILSPLFGIISALSGYWIAMYFDVTIAGAMATMVGIIFALIFIFLPDRGLIANIRRRKEQKYEFALISLLMHLINHENSPIEREEAGINTIKNHLSWDKEFTQEIIDKTLDKNYVYIKDEILKITDKGREFALSNYSYIVEQD
ncbi:MAG: metal ABC transporter permease [Tissierellia bacterium]|nr:metal ABC transporter permease [Tissierellia bacterium]